jgi:hypothetical protein
MTNQLKIEEMFESSHRLQQGKGFGNEACPPSSFRNPPLEKSGGGEPSSLAPSFLKRIPPHGKQHAVPPFSLKIKSPRFSQSGEPNPSQPASSLPGSKNDASRYKIQVIQHESTATLPSLSPSKQYLANLKKYPLCSSSFGYNFSTDNFDQIQYTTSYLKPKFPSHDILPIDSGIQLLKDRSMHLSGFGGQSIEPATGEPLGEHSTVPFLTVSRSEVTRAKSPQPFHSSKYNQLTPVADD